MNSADSAAVMVGVDGSEPSLRAVRLAAAEAVRRHRPLRVVHGFIWPVLHVPVSPAPDAPDCATGPRSWSPPRWPRPRRPRPG